MLSRISKISKLCLNTTFIPKPYSRFCTAFYSPHRLQFSDVLKVDEDDKGPFLNLPGRTLSIDPNLTIYHFKEMSKFQYSDIKNIKIYDEKLVEFSDTAPVILLLKENFLLKVNQEWYSIITETEDPLFNSKVEQSLDEKPIYALCQQAGCSVRQTATLVDFISSLANDLYDHAHNQVDSQIIKTIVEKNLYGRSIEAKQAIEKIDMKLQVLRKKLESFEEIKKTVDAKLIAKGKKRIKRFSLFLLSQLALIQYGTYVAFSWDVMEPITALLGIMDVIIAYSFWLVTNKSFSYHNIGKSYIESRRNKAYKKIEFDIEEYEETKELIKLLETQKLLLSPKIEDLLQALQLLEAKTNKSDNDEEEEEELPIKI